MYNPPQPMFTTYSVQQQKRFTKAGQMPKRLKYLKLQNKLKQ